MFTYLVPSYMKKTCQLFCFWQFRLLSAHNRFYTALALHDLVNEVPLMVVSAKYGASKGMLQVHCLYKLYWNIFNPYFHIAIRFGQSQ